MNNAFVLLMSDAVAARLQTNNTDTDAQVRELFRLAYSREASNKDIRQATPFVIKHGLSAYCRVVFNSNELLYVR